MEHGRLLGSENAVYDTVMVDTCHYTFAHGRRLNSIKSEPGVKYALVVIRMYQCGPINCNKRITLIAREGMWEISVPST